MNYNHYIVFDFETTSVNPYTTQPVQLASVIVDARRLKIKPGSEFSSLIKPYDEETSKSLGLDPLTEDAIKIHKKTPEMLSNAPTIDVVWSNFVDYVMSHRVKKDQWSAHIPAGYNIRGYDMIIVNRLCCSDPYNFGPKDKYGKQAVFHPIHALDLMDVMFLFFENNPDIRSLSMDNLVRGYMGYEDKGQAHDALTDVVATAELLCRSLHLMRRFSAKVKFKNSMKNNARLRVLG